MESENHEAAEMQVLDLLRKEEFWQDKSNEQKSQDAKVYFKEIDEIEFIPEDVPNKGYTFYIMDEEE